MSVFLYFFTADGTCVRCVGCDAQDDAQAVARSHLPYLPAGCLVAVSTEEHEPTTVGHDGVGLVRKPACQARYDAVGRTLVNLPVPCRVWIDSVRYDCSTPTCELDLTPGRYTLRITSATHCDMTMEIEQ